jgi:hypothetical protein
MPNNEGTLSQYLGRKADLVAFQLFLESGINQLDMSLSKEGQGGAIVVGPQKVVQRFLLELFREKGSMTLRPRGGTDFITEFRLGYMRTPVDVTGAFARAVVDIRNTLQAEESDDDPDDERFANATLLSTEVTGTTAVVKAQIETRAGTSRDFVFPLPITV